MEDNLKIIGRREEIELFRNCYESGKPELIIVYGRRRVGKTFLIKKLFGDEFAFYMSGLYKAPKKRQLANFAYSLSQYTGNDEETPESWTDAFRRLKDYLKSIETPGRKVVFIDELPWLDTKRSDLIEALDLFWNAWGNDEDNLMLILCGSATGWMTDKLLGDKGGMFNRDTLRLFLSPFTLGETEQFLHSKNINASRYEIAEYYMIMGGIPYYLDKIKRGKSVAQNIDLLFFKRRGLLWDEFRHLYQTLFSDNKKYVQIVRFLSTRREGYTREEIAHGTGLEPNGDLTKYLSDLNNCDFINAYRQFGKKNNVIYRLSDLYTLFYFRFLEKYGDANAHEENYWSKNIDNPERRSWTGYAFEEVCLWHLPQIKNALGLSHTSANCSTFRKNEGDIRTQIDLIIDRRDDVVNLCEIKFSKDKFSIDKSYEDKLKTKIEILKPLVSPHQSLQLTMITTHGLTPSTHNAIIDSSLNLDQLF